MMTKKIAAYKGFNEDWTCRDFQFEVGKTYKHKGKVEACNSGFHACENPLDVWGYYPPAQSKFAEVSLGGKTDKKGEDSKIAAASLTVEVELSLPEFIKRGVDYILSRVTDEKRETNTGNRSAATNTGNRSAATNTGDWSAATNTGYRSAATNTGYRSAATNTGDWSAATNTGNQSAATNTGDWSAATNTGNRSAATNTGNWSAATNTGNRSAATVEGEDSVAIATGREGKARASKGCALFLVERDDDMKIVHVWSGIAGKKKIKPGTFYTLKDGKPVEVQDDQSS